MKKEKLNAVDVLNWEYLVEISEYWDPNQKPNPTQAINGFAYSFVSTASEGTREKMLTAILLNATRWSSTEANETYVAWLARMLKSDLTLLRSFAKQVGVRLRRD